VTIYPFKIPLPFFPHELTGYGLMMMVAFLTGGWLITLELRRRRLAEDYSADLIAAAVIGGVIGAKLWYVALTRDPNTLFERGGFVWYGGFLGGTAAVMLNGWRLRVPLRWTMQLVAPALAAAYALGRVGCFLVNDDYGRPTSLPWAVKFPQGLPPSTAGNLHGLFGVPVPPGIDPSTVLAVHPTQLYETGLMLLAFFALWAWRRRAKPIGWLFGVYLVFAGIERLPHRLALRCVPRVRRHRAVPDRDPPRQGRSFARPVYAGAAHLRHPGRRGRLDPDALAGRPRPRRRPLSPR
jgi:phosphatidylglycerol---prolipoprotein diacylglyceryl transferase